MHYSPKGNKGQAVSAVMTLFLSALILTGFSVTINSFAANLMKCIASVIFLTCILIVPRFLLDTYIYVVDDMEISVILKKTQKTVCRLFYSEILAVEPHKNVKNKIKGRTKHNYCVTMFPKNVTCIIFENGDKEEVILLEGDHALESLIKKHVSSDILDT